VLLAVLVQMLIAVNGCVLVSVWVGLHVVVIFQEWS